MAEATLAELLLAAEPRAGSTRVLAIDGRSGSGKSTLASLAAAGLDSPIVALEQMYGGWRGLREGCRRLVREVLEPLAAGRPAVVPHYDWEAEEWLEPTVLERPAALVVEGVGAGCLSAAPMISLLVWVELDAERRRTRALARDRGVFDPYWDMWSAQEDDYLASDRTPERADLIVPGG
jgi:uridine kinase